MKWYKTWTLEREEAFASRTSFDDSKFKLCGKEKFSCNKSLLTYRTVQFLWYGAGALPSLFLGIFLKQRGLTLVEISSSYSMIFVFQFLNCSIAGIITDKIGNAKPVLMFLMFFTSFSLVCMLLIPKLNSTPCNPQEEHFENFNLSHYDQNFNSCFKKCLYKNKIHEQNYSQNSSAVETFDFEKNSSKIPCIFSYNSSTNTSLLFPSADCCSTCANSTTADCALLRNRYIVIVYAILVLAFYSVWNTAFRFMNFTAISLAEKIDSDFGKEVAVGQCGFIFILIIVAFVLNIDQSPNSKINYDPPIAIAVGIMLCSFLTLFLTEIPILPPGKELLKNALNLVRNIDILAFVLLVFAAGTGYGFNSAFRLVYLETLRASSIFVGLHSVATASFGLPLLLSSKWWLEKFGSNVLFVSCLLLQVVNSIAYSYILNPWWALLIDVTGAFTLDLFWVAVVTHCWNVAPVGFAATLNALTGAVHYGIGRSSGVFFGGMLMNYVGPRQTYRIMAAAFLTIAILYSAFICKRRTSLTK